MGRDARLRRLGEAKPTRAWPVRDTLTAKAILRMMYFHCVRIAHLLLAATLCILTTAELPAQSVVLLENTTAADLERDVTASERMFLSYIDRVKLPDLAKDNSVLARDLKIYFHDKVKGGSISQGLMDFDVKMQHLEAYAKAHNEDLADYPSAKIADLVWSQAVRQEKAKPQSR